MFSKLSAHLNTNSTPEVAQNSPAESSSNLPALALGSDAHYSRLGDDLSIKVAGEKFVVTDYFLHPTPLKTAQGETLSVDQVHTQLLPAPVMVADNSNSVPLEKIGTVSMLLKEPVEAKGLDGAVRLLKQGDAVYLHDTITTPVGGYLKIMLHDGTTFQLGPLSRATLDKYSYDPTHANAGGHFETTVAAGVFRFVSGKISGNNQGQHTLIKTPSAVIGIRGSELDIHVNADGSVVVVHSSGFVDVTSLFHPEQHLSLFEHGTTVYIPADAGGTPTVGISAPAFVQEFRNQLLPNNPYAPAPSGADALRHEGHGFEGDPNRPSPLSAEERFEHGSHGEGKEPPPPPGSRPPEIMEFAKDHPEFRPPMPDDIGKARWVMAGKNAWIDEHVNGERLAFLALNLSDRLQLDLPPNLLKDYDPRVLNGLLEKIDKIEHHDEPLDHLDPNKPLPLAMFTEDNALVTPELITPEQAELVTLIQPQFGTVINNYDGTFTYRPNSIGFTGEDHFSYRVETPLGQRVNPVRLNTVADNFTEVTVDIAPMVSFKLGMTVTGSDSTGNNLTGTITEFTQPEHGKLVLDEKTGAVVYVPSERNFNGDDSFTYLLKTSDSDPGVWVHAEILVTHVNNEPVAVADRFDEINPVIPNKVELLTTLEDNALLISQETLLKNDSDVDKYDVLQVLRVEPVVPTEGVTSTDVATHGSVFINPEGNIIYTPDPDYYGPATFKYTTVDQFGARSTAFVTVNVLPVNDAPVAKPIAFVLNAQNTVDVPSVAVLANVTDVDNEPSSLKLVGVSDALHGQVSLTADNRVVFVPDALGDKFITGEFNYTVSDGQLSSTGHVLVLRDTTSLPNIPDIIIPTDTSKLQVIPDIVQLSTVQTSIISAQQLLSNDSVPQGRVLSITSVSEGVNAAVALTSSGDIQITPDALGTKLGVASFKYTVTDNLGNSDVGIVAVNIPADTSNPLTLLAHDDALNIAPDNVIKIAASSLLSNDFNPTGELIKITALGTALKGTVSLDSNNDVIFTKAADFNGLAEFDYQITSTSGKTSSAHVVLTGLVSNNALPDAQADNLGAQAKNQPVTIPVSQLLANDSDPQGAVLNVQRVLTPVHGTVQLDATAQNVIFTPDPNYVGKAGFSYLINNGTNNSLPAIVTLDIVNTPPQATAITGLNTGVNHPLQIAGKDILAAVSDADKGDVLTLKTVGNAVNGSVELTPTGDVIFTPNKDYQGAASFQYTVVDSSQASSSAAVEVKVSSGILIANPDTFTVPKNVESTLAAKDLLANDSAINPLTDKLSIIAASQPTQGGTSISSAGDVVFIPHPGFVGKTEFQYTLQDNNGNQSVAKVTLDVANHAPIAQPDNFTEPANTSTITLKVADLLVNDTDPDGDVLKLTAVSDLSNGKVSLDAANGVISLAPDAAVTHTGGIASFNYTVDDGTGGTAQGVVNFNFAPNQAPVVSLSSTSALTYHLGDAALTVDSAARISDIDTSIFNQGLLKISLRNPLSGDSLEVHNIGGISTVSPSGGALVFDGKTIGSFSSSSSDLSIQLNENADISATTALLQAVTYKNTTVDNSALALPTGIRTLDISLNDGAGGVSALVSRDINVESTSKPPTAVADTLSKSFGVVTSIAASELLANDVNPNPSELLTLSNVSNLSAGVNARLVNNEVQLFIDAFSGSTDAHFDYSIVNGSGQSSTATVTIKADNLVIGTPNADTLLDYNKANFTLVEGLDGNDSFGLSSGAAKLFGGAGNDSFNFDPSASAGLSIDGGTGTDTVSLNNATGKTIDLTQNASLPSDQQYSLRNIDVINIATGSTGNNTLRLGLSDVLNITDNKSLTIEGNAGSVVISPGQGWSNQGASATGNYTHYSAGGADLLVSNEINAQFIS
ncbi:MAG: Ig-like domain-containing protein [Thiotrichaceae bacterium]|nr:Ig-like domain-containing protein [Thiotrichaceae bacterium]